MSLGERADLLLQNAASRGDVPGVVAAATTADETPDAEFFPGMDKTWGLSFMINTEQAPTGRAAGSLAWAGLANSFYWIDVTNGIGGVYLTQILPFADKKSLSLYLDFERTVYENR